MFYRIYHRLLRLYQREPRNGRTSLFQSAFELSIALAASVLMWWQRFSFPERTTGGWWWVERYRFECLAGWAEKESMAWCTRLIKPGMTVIDVGAHIGLYTRLFSKLAGRTGRVLAFEANSENFAVLERNLRGYRNVELFQICVADHDGVFTLHVSPGHSNHSLLPGFTASTSAVEVEGVALDSFLRRRGIHNIGFIKSDTEGAEPLVVAGMTKTLAGTLKPGLLLEYHPAAMRCGGTQPEELTASLESFGYRVEAVHPDGSLGEIPPLTGSAYCNILCRPK